MKKIRVLLAAACLIGSGYYLLQGMFELDKFYDSSTVETAIQQGAIASYATGKLLISAVLALWAIVFAIAASVGVTDLSEVTKHLKELDERDLNFKEWQLKEWQAQQNLAPHAQNVQYPPGGQLGH